MHKQMQDIQVKLDRARAEAAKQPGVAFPVMESPLALEAGAEDYLPVMLLAW